MKKLILILLLSVVACDDLSSSNVSSDSGAQKASVKIQTDADGWTIEQKNIAARLKADNTPGAIKHIYVISAFSGQVILYSTVKGKVTSSEKRLSPTSVVVGSGGDWRRPGFAFTNDFVTSEVLQDDGTYGSSVEYIYWWDVQGRYHQHYISGGQIVHVSDQPIAVKNIILNLEQQKSEN